MEADLLRRARFTPSTFHADPALGNPLLDVVDEARVDAFDAVIEAEHEACLPALAMLHGEGA